MEVQGDGVTTAPGAAAPTAAPPGPAPAEQPYLTMLPLADRVRDISQSVVDAIYGMLQGTAARTDLAQDLVRSEVIGSLEDVQSSYASCAYCAGDRVMAALMPLVGRMAALPVAPITEQELALIANRLAPPAPALPPTPCPNGPWLPRPAPRMVFATGPGVPYGIPTMPTRPGWVPELVDRYRPAPPPVPTYVPYGSAPPQPPSGIVVPPSGTTRPTLAPPGSPSSGPLSPGPPSPAAPTAGPPTVPGSIPVGVSPMAPAAPPPGQTDGPQQEGACPPVHVHIHCGPGTVAEQTEGEPPPEGTQFISAPGPVVRPEDKAAYDAIVKADQERKSKPGFKPDDDEIFRSDTVRWAEYLGQDHNAPLPMLLARIFGTKEGREEAKGKPAQLPALVTPEVFALWRRLLKPDDCSELVRAAKELGVSLGSLNDAVAGRGDGGQLRPDTYLGQLRDSLGQTVGGPIAGALAGLWDLLGGAITVSQTAAGCDSPAYVLLAAARAGLGVIQEWAGAPFPEARQKIEQATGMLCAVGIPSAGEADAMYLADVIDAGQWVCLVTANGQRRDWGEKRLQAQRTIPSPLQIVNVWHRKGGKPAELSNMLRQAGVIEQRHVEWFEALGTYVPAPGDLVTFMVRDVFDKAIVLKYGYDDEFADKFAGEAEKWARAQGMTEDQFKLYWRAHWRLPSPTQGYEMLHRLRPGRVAPELVTDRKTVDELLRVDDYPTYWRQRLIELSYRPMTRVDVRRSYFLGSLSEKDTTEAIKDLGYNDRDARLLLEFWQAERINWVLNQPFAKAYVKGLLSDAELNERLDRLNLSPNQRDQVEQEVQLREGYQLRAATLKGIKRRVLVGLADWESARDELAKLGYRVSRATAMAQAWQEERRAKGRVPTAAQLCKMYSLGILSGEEYTAALLRIGYDLADVKRIIALCEVKEKLPASDFGATSEKGEALVQQLERAAQTRQVRQANAAAARAARARRQLGLVEEKVIKRLVSTANTLARTYGGDRAEYLKTVQKFHADLTDEACYTRQGAADLVHSILTGLAQQRAEEWKQIAADYFAALPPRPCPPADEPSNDRIEEKARK